MSAVRVELYGGVLETLARSPAMRSVIRKVADALKDEAVAIAPKDHRNYVDHIDVTDEADEDGLVSHVNARWFTSHWIEFGTVDTPVFAPLRKASGSGAVKRVLQ